jgi:hypothetical protein
VFSSASHAESAAPCRPDTLRYEFELIEAELGSTTGRTDESLRRALTYIRRFAGRLGLEGVTSVREITHAHAWAFLHEAHAGSHQPEPSLVLMTARRDAIRLVVRTARLLQLVDPSFDPTVDIVLSTPPKVPRRPLTDAEELLGRLAADAAPLHSRRSAAWALGQASGNIGELAVALRRDLDLEADRVWLRGTGNRVPRWGSLTPWGVDRLAARVRGLDEDPDTPLVGGTGTLRSALAASTTTIIEVLELAGLRDGFVVPSLPNWAGRRAFDQTGRIEEAARTLGLRSLDRAARAIGWTWR